MAKRVIVKVGTGAISNTEGQLDGQVLKSIVAGIVELREKGIQVVLVTSGAVGVGKDIFSRHPKGSPVVQKQLYAAIGQAKLMSLYSELLEEHGYLCAQVLATKEDFRDETHYKNMQNCFNALLPDGVVPIVNENDVVATTELVFTDNDELASLVARQLKADALIILTTTDGILDPAGNTVKEVNKDTAAEVEKYVSADVSATGRGGMRAKFNIARSLGEEGIEVYIANGKKQHTFESILEGGVPTTHFMVAKTI